VFAVDVERARALEWSSALGTWSVLDTRAHIADPVLAAPLPIEALLRAAKADDAMARALIAKRNPVIEAVRAEGKLEGLAEGISRGRAEGLAESLIVMLEARDVALGSADRARILGERDPATLARWTVRAATCKDVVEMFGGA
jgi:hypothetical protein